MLVLCIFAVAATPADALVVYNNTSVFTQPNETLTATYISGASALLDLLYVNPGNGLGPYENGYSASQGTLVDIASNTYVLNGSDPNNPIYYRPSDPQFIATNYSTPPGTTVDLGSFDPDTELIFTLKSFPDSTGAGPPEESIRRAA